jgi:hypothetical protein
MSVKRGYFPSYCTFFKSLESCVLGRLLHVSDGLFSEWVHFYCTVFGLSKPCSKRAIENAGMCILLWRNALRVLLHVFKPCSKPCSENPQTVHCTLHVSPLYIGGNVQYAVLAKSEDARNLGETSSRQKRRKTMRAGAALESKHRSGVNPRIMHPFPLCSAIWKNRAFPRGFLNREWPRMNANRRGKETALCPFASLGVHSRFLSPFVYFVYFVVFPLVAALPRCALAFKIPHLPGADLIAGFRHLFGPAFQEASAIRLDAGHSFLPNHALDHGAKGGGQR